MEVLKICAAATVAVFMISILKPVKKEFAIAVSIVCGVFIFSLVFSYLKSIVETVKRKRIKKTLNPHIKRFLSCLKNF